MAHHTKDKGDLGVAKAIADLTSQGFVVLLPMTEHAPFDLVVYRDGQLHRVQVKYRTMRLGAVEVQFKSTWSDSNGTHSRPMNRAEVDVICIYCPETDECYYVRLSECPATSVTVRVAPSRNNQRAGVVLGSMLRELPTAATDPLRLC